MAQAIDHLNEKVLVNNLIFGAVGASSRNMASFSGWLLAGFAGVTAVVLNNLAEVSRHLPPFALHTVFTTFFVSAILAVIAKAISVFIVAASTGAAIGRAEGSAAASSGARLDVAWFFAEMGRTVIWPIRGLVRRSFAKVEQGNLTASSRVFAYVAQAQGILILAQALLVLWAIGVVACTVTF